MRGCRHRALEKAAPRVHQRPHGGQHRCSASWALLLASLSLCATAVGYQSCESYVPGACLFSTYDDRPVVFPRPLHASSFNLEKEVTCPFHGAGTFARKRKQQCGDPFMSARKRQLPQARSDGYCSSGSLGGEFKRQGKRFYYEPHPEHDCSYFEYTRAEVLNFLQAEQMDILVAGDSMMRQLFVRLVHMMRGARRVVDYHIHTPASYSVCAQADRFTMSPVNRNHSHVETFKKLDIDFLQESMPALFQYDSTEQAMLACAEPHVNINYMHAPDFELQQQFLEHYMETVAKPSKERSLTLVLSVGYWVWTPEVPQEYLDSLVALSERVHRIILLSIPTVHTLAHTGKQGPSLLHAYRSRNLITKQWVESGNSTNIVFIDFDAMSLSRHAPPICVGENWHYQCFLTWPAATNKAVLHDKKTNYFRDRIYRAPLTGLYMTEDGQCFDEMNRNVWQIAFNLMMK